MEISKKPLTLWGSFIVSALAIGFLWPARVPVWAGPKNSPSGLRAAMKKIPLYFIENAGQVDPRVAYYIRGRDKHLYFAPDGVTFVLSDRAPQLAARSENSRSLNTARDTRPVVTENSGRRLSVKLDFVDSDPNVKPRGENLAPPLISYFKGPRDQWKSGLKTYTRLVYPDLWPGIDLIYSGTVDRLKYMFVVKPGADPGRIQLAYRGAETVTLTGDGTLEVTTSLGSFRDDRPAAYQERSDGVADVNVSYDLQAGSESGSQRYGFHVGLYDPAQPLIIDPAIFVYAGFIGGSGDDRGRGIAVDAEGNAYVTGETSSTQGTFPPAVGLDATQNGGVDAFVAKLDPTGTNLLYVGFIGGSADDRGNAIAVDTLGNAYITGATSSTGATFPVVGGPDLTHNGGVDAFVAKISPSGENLIYAGFIGGFGDDQGNGIAIDSMGNAYITGATSSTAGAFPVISGPDLTHNGGVDAFVAKVGASGASLIYSGFIGGSGDDQGNGIAIDSLGNAYITGATNSTEFSFPATVGPSITQNGGIDAFVAKVGASGASLIYSGFIGGFGDDRGNGIAIDSLGNAYITGATNSTGGTFPVVSGPDLTHNGGVDAFVTKVSASGASLIYSGFIGGFGDDRGNGIAVDSSGSAYVTGETDSTAASFPVAVGPDLTHNGGVDAFVTKVSASGASLIYSGFIGGTGDDRGHGIATNLNGDAYIAGETDSNQSTFPVKTGPDLTTGGRIDAFVAKICSSPCVDLRIVDHSDSPDPVRVGDDLTYTIMVQNNGPDDATGVELTDVLPKTVVLLSAVPSSGSCTGAGPVFCDLGDLPHGGSATVTIVVAAAAKGTLVNSVFVSADQTDTDTSNNADTQRTVSTLANLVLRRLSAVKAVIAGSSIDVEDTTKNSGRIPAEESVTRFYFSTDAKLDKAVDTPLGERSVAALAAKAEDSGVTTVTIPSGIALGRYYLIGAADDDTMVAETIESNKKARALRVTLPDLGVSRLRAPSSAAAGASILVEDTTKNRGLVDAAGSTTEFFLSTDVNLDVADMSLGSRGVGTLAAKTQSIGATAVTIPVATAPGKYYLIAEADASGAIAETDEGNNHRSRIITVTP